MVNELLGGLFGGQDEDDDAKRQNRAADFVNRYQTGQPWENISGDEALQNYKSVAGKLSPDQYQEAATEAISRLSPEQRQQLAGVLQQGTGVTLSGGADDPAQLAQLTNQVRQGGGSGLSALLGGGSVDDLLGNSGALGGLLGGGGGGLLGGLLGGGDDRALSLIHI